MIRATIRDSRKTISFPAGPHLVQSLIAACTSDPSSVEDLLLAAEPFAPGTTAQVIDGLLDFDIRHESRSRTAGPATFEVINGATEELARRPDNDGLLRIDLVDRIVEGRLPSPDLLASRGTISSPGGWRTAYALGPAWHVVRIETVPQAVEVAQVA